TQQTIQITYRELNEKSNLLATQLRSKGVQPGSIVGIKTGRSVEMMTAILATLKAGGAYLPIDPAYPRERIRYMLADSNACIVLCEAGENNEKNKTEINGGSGNTESIIIRDLYKQISTAGVSLKDGEYNRSFITNEAGKERDPQEPALAYIIYTSGSTGKPKGVMIEHPSFLNFIKGMTRIIEFNLQDCILSLTTICFDIFGLETLLPLTTGTKVVIGSGREQREPDAAGLLMKQERV
ncbi:MAG: AMP-binding protein, partial [bacterium]|nr:AMP-binding protein [bacterium]